MIYGLEFLLVRPSSFDSLRTLSEDILEVMLDGKLSL